MKNNTEIWVCSNSALDYLNHPETIRILRSTISFGSSTTIYEDYIDMDSDTFYDRLETTPDDIPKTAYVSIGKVDQYFEDAKKRGIKDILVILISGELSGLYAFFEQYAHQHQEDSPRIHPFDSRTLVFAESFMALSAHNMLREGKSVPEVIEVLSTIRDHNHIYFAVDTLKYLVLNGRLSKSSALIGNFLKVKPLLQLAEGKVVPLEKTRTSKAAIGKLVQRYQEVTLDKTVLTYIAHANHIEEAKRIQALIQSEAPERQVIICPLSPVVGAHSGPKSIAIGFIELDPLASYPETYFKLDGILDPQ